MARDSLTSLNMNRAQPGEATATCTVTSFPRASVSHSGMKVGQTNFRRVDDERKDPLSKQNIPQNPGGKRVLLIRGQVHGPEGKSLKCA